MKCKEIQENVNLQLKNKKKQELKEKGITLIALVVTIIILLILAGTTVAFTLGNQGIITKAKQAEEKYKEAQEQEEEKLNFLHEEIENGGKRENPLANLIGQESKNENQDVTDAYGNKITIPAEFIVVRNGQQNVEYNYSGDGRPNVQDGVVIQDEDGNQFVWIPVGKIKNKDGTTTTIKLGRYDFNKQGKEELKQVADDFGGEIPIQLYYNEESKYRVGEKQVKGGKNTTARNLSEFIMKVKEKGGYYIARYEAVYKDGNIPYSKQSQGKPRSSNEEVITDGMLWNCISQPAAAEASYKMYEKNNFCASDLINSYAWDTAIVFIQKFSNDKLYSKKSINGISEVENTGDRKSDSLDKVCNIYDLATNCFEWTTESCFPSGDVLTSHVCTRRGESFYGKAKGGSARYNDHAACENFFDTFRVLLYLK